MDAFGYNATVLQEGQALPNAARNLHDAQIKEYGGTQAFVEISKQADKTYTTHQRAQTPGFQLLV